MRNYKLSIFLASIGIILVSLVIIVSSYAYFTIKVNGEGEEIEITTFDQNTTIIFNDTSNVSLVNAYTGDEITKTFSVENTSDLLMYYDIVLNNVVNNFENKNDLIYSIEEINGKGAKREESILPSEDVNIASDLLIMPHTKHEYTMNIKFLKTNEDQSNNMDKTFSSNIKIEGSKNINVGELIYKNNTLLSKIINSTNDEGVYYTNNSTFGYPVYYFKGDNSINNNLIYNNMCFKILRTDENYGIRLVYNGKYENGSCSESKTIGNSAFNTKSESNAYVGYMYGNASSNNYKNEHNNINSSIIKDTLEDWYKENFINDNNVSNDAIFCNNRQTNSFRLGGVLYGTNGYGNTNSGYYIFKNTRPTYSCNNLNDRFSKVNKDSNKLLKYPVGLITVDELLYSGLNFDNQTDNYLNINDTYYTITPAYFNGSGAYNYIVSNNIIKSSVVTKEYGIRPVISLNKNVEILMGDGSQENPYMIK